MFSTLLSSFTIYADAPSEDKENKENKENKEAENRDDKEVEEGGDEAKHDEGGEPEEEEEEPEDIHPTLREECSNSAKCIGFKKHFEHCQEKVEAGKGFKGEDCVEEIVMHCADNCVAPTLFTKLR